MCLLAVLFSMLIRHPLFRPRRFTSCSRWPCSSFYRAPFRNWELLQSTAKNSANPPVDYSPQVVEYHKNATGSSLFEDMVVLILAGKEVPRTGNYLRR